LDQRLGTRWNLPLVLFLNYRFLQGLEKSHSIGKETGWKPLYLAKLDSAKKGILYFFEKRNSYGEYIFDWDWADAYHRHGIPYFPKFTSMIPFTPVITPHFVMKEFDNDLAHDLLNEFEKFYQAANSTSAHFLFLAPEELPIFKAREYLIRESIQYHFYNDDYEDFETLLGTFKKKKAKQIIRERKSTHRLRIESFTGEDLTPQHALQMYRFYNSTIAIKGAIPYLNQDFFSHIFGHMKSSILYIQASETDKPIAGALYFYDSKRLYGRYWGTIADYPNLHFELCYYRGIEFCIKKKLSVFEAGAQGEHKISRGFKPIRTYSAHLLKNRDFQNAIEDFISNERELVSKTIEHLKGMLPFHSTERSEWSSINQLEMAGASGRVSDLLFANSSFLIGWLKLFDLIGSRFFDVYPPSELSSLSQM